MEEDIKAIINSYHPNETDKFPGIDDLKLTWKYLTPPEPNAKKVRVFYRHLTDPSRSPKASLCIIHGYAEHSGKLLNIAAHFALNNFEVHLVDLRAFGLSGGARCGHDMLEFQQDVALMLQQVNPNLPCFLYGHSMGGLLLTTILINNPSLPIAGAIISAPAYESSSVDTSAGKIAAMKGMVGIMKEGVFNPYIAPSSLSRDDVFVKNFHSDTKLIPFAGPGLFLSVTIHMKKVSKHAYKIKHPIVFFHGDADILTSPQSTEQVFKAVKSADKQLVFIPGSYHEAHHDLDRDRVIAEMFEWADRRVRNLPFSNPAIVIGEPGLEKPSNWCMKIFLVLLGLYVLLAFKLRVKIGPNSYLKVLKILNFFARVFWPIGLCLS